MKEVRINRLAFSNWRAQSRVVDFKKTTCIEGRNKSGKSTIFNAWLWLMLGVDEQGRANYKIFNDKTEATPENSAPAVVECSLSIDGLEYVFKKEARIGWVRRRGKSEYERAGTDSYKYYMDGIEVNASDYKDKVETLLAPSEQLKIMLNLRYFQTLDWKEIRKMLEPMAGAISFADFHGDYGIIEQDLEKYNIEELKKVYSSKKKEIGKATDSLPIAIDTLKSHLPSALPPGEAQETISRCDDEYAAFIEDMKGAKSSIQPYIDKRDRELGEINRLMEDYKAAEGIYVKGWLAELSRLTAELDKAINENKRVEQSNRNKEKEEKRLRDKICAKEEELESLRSYRETLLRKNKETKAMTFEADKCPYCGQSLPECRLEEQRSKFNEEKERKRSAILAEGKANNVKISACEAEIAELNGRLADIDKSPLPIKDTKDMEDEISAYKAKFVEYGETAEGSAKLACIEEKKAALTCIPRMDDSALQEKGREILSRKNEAVRMLTLERERDRQLQEVASLERDLRSNMAEAALIEAKMLKLKEYEQERAELVNERVSSFFDYISIKMSEQNKSGEYVPSCIIVDGEGVNSLVTNNASRIMCGFHLSLGFQKFLGVSVPMFIDNAESITDHKELHAPGQIILLEAKDCDFAVSANEQ